MCFFLESKEIGLSSNKTVMHLEYIYRKLERKKKNAKF